MIHPAITPELLAAGLLVQAAAGTFCALTLRYIWRTFR